MLKFKMKEHKTDGMLITFCGLDGCGKSTMIRMLSELIAVQRALQKDPNTTGFPPFRFVCP